MKYCCSIILPGKTVADIAIIEAKDKDTASRKIEDFLKREYEGAEVTILASTEAVQNPIK